MHGLRRGVLKTALSVCITSPITSAIITALFADPDDFATVYIEALSTTMPMTMFVSFFIVGPAVKLVCNNRVSSAGSMRILLDMKNYAPALSRLLGM